MRVRPVQPERQVRLAQMAPRARGALRAGGSFYRLNRARTARWGRLDRRAQRVPLARQVPMEQPARQDQRDLRHFFWPNRAKRE